MVPISIQAIQTEQQTASTSVPAAVAASPPALSEIESLKARLEFKDLLIDQKDFDNLYQQFLANDAVKAVQKRIQERQARLQALEQALLTARKLTRETHYLDFLTGEIKPVEKAPEKK